MTTLTVTGRYRLSMVSSSDKFKSLLHNLSIPTPPMEKIQMTVFVFNGQKSLHYQSCALTNYQTTNFRLKLKKFADDNFKFDENSRKLSKRL